MDNLRRLEEIFGHFPGIGPRQARRFVYYLLNKSPAFIADFTELIEKVKQSTSECDSCHRIFIQTSYHIPRTSAIKTPLLCSICADKNRDHSTLMIVARDSDFESIEKSGAYKGLYFILGGTIPILDKEPEKRIRLKRLLERIQIGADVRHPPSTPPTPPLTEIILSLNTTPDGENTADYIKKALADVGHPPKQEAIKITVLGRGLSTGAELEYVDGDTIRNALKHRE